jgi:hypothetical protein
MLVDSGMPRIAIVTGATNPVASLMGCVGVEAMPSVQLATGWQRGEVAATWIIIRSRANETRSSNWSLRRRVATPHDTQRLVGVHVVGTKPT